VLTTTFSRDVLVKVHDPPLRQRVYVEAAATTRTQ